MSIRLATFNRDTSEDGRRRVTRAWHCDLESEIDGVVSDHRFYAGLSAITDRASNWDPDTIESGFRVEINYEGTDTTQYAPNVPERGRWSFRPSFEKEPMEKHPAIQRLIEFYDGEIDPETKRVSFPETFYRSDSGEAPGRSNHWQAGNTSGSSTLQENPLYGLSESGYLALTGIATVRYTTNGLSSALERLGEIYESLPYNAPGAFEIDGRNWLKAPPTIDELGKTDGEDSYAVEETYLLSERGGWPAAVYDFIDL